MCSLDRHKAVGPPDDRTSREHWSINTASCKTDRGVSKRANGDLRVWLKLGQDMGIKEQRGSSQEMWRSSDSNRAQTSGIRTTSGVFPNDLEGTDKLSPAQGKQQGQSTKRMQKKVSHRLQHTHPTLDFSQESREYDDSRNNN